MAYPSDLKYTKDHEWVRLSGDTAEVGITDYAQQQLGDVVFVDLPAVGTAVTAGTAVRHHRVGKGRVRALRAALSGEIVAVNDRLAQAPEDVNTRPHETWMVQIRVPAALPTASSTAPSTRRS